MSEVEINWLIEKLIRIRDRYKTGMTRSESDALAVACNLIYHNIDKLVDEDKTVRE